MGCVLWQWLGRAQATFCLKSLFLTKTTVCIQVREMGEMFSPSEQRGSLSSPPSSSVFFHVNESHLHKHFLLHPHPHMVLGLKTGQLYLTVEIERREQAACSLLTSAQFCFLSWWSQLRLCSWRGRCVLPSRPAAEMEVNPLCLWSAWGVLSPPPVASLLVKNIILSPSFT